MLAIYCVAVDSALWRSTTNRIYIRTNRTPYENIAERFFPIRRYALHRCRSRSIPLLSVRQPLAALLHVFVQPFYHHSIRSLIRVSSLDFSSRSGKSSSISSANGSTNSVGYGAQFTSVSFFTLVSSPAIFFWCVIYTSWWNRSKVSTLDQHSGQITFVVQPLISSTYNCMRWRRIEDERRRRKYSQETGNVWQESRQFSIDGLGIRILQLYLWPLTNTTHIVRLSMSWCWQSKARPASTQ